MLRPGIRAVYVSTALFCYVLRKLRALLSHLLNANDVGLAVHGSRDAQVKLVHSTVIIIITIVMHKIFSIIIMMIIILL